MMAHLRNVKPQEGRPQEGRPQEGRPFSTPNYVLYGVAIMMAHLRNVKPQEGISFSTPYFTKKIEMDLLM